VGEEYTNWRMNALAPASRRWPGSPRATLVVPRGRPCAPPHGHSERTRGW